MARAVLVYGMAGLLTEFVWRQNLGDARLAQLDELGQAILMGDLNFALDQRGGVLDKLVIEGDSVFVIP